jgi:hypothetical protein
MGNNETELFPRTTEGKMYEDKGVTRQWKLTGVQGHRYARSNTRLNTRSNIRSYTRPNTRSNTKHDTKLTTRSNPRSNTQSNTRSNATSNDKIKCKTRSLTFLQFCIY